MLTCAFAGSAHVSRLFCFLGFDRRHEIRLDLLDSSSEQSIWFGCRRCFRGVGSKRAPLLLGACYHCLVPTFQPLDSYPKGKTVIFSVLAHIREHLFLVFLSFRNLLEHSGFRICMSKPCSQLQFQLVTARTETARTQMYRPKWRFFSAVGVAVREPTALFFKKKKCSLS